MTPEKTTLIVCRDCKSLSYLSHLKQNEDSYVVASDDPAVQAAAKDRYGFEVSWIETADPFYDVAEDVLACVDVIEAWLHSIALSRGKKDMDPLLFWVRFCEGGMTSQRIQDALLLIRAYRTLFKKLNAKKIIVLGHLSLWENQVLFEVASSLGIECEFHASKFGLLFFRARETALLWARSMYYAWNFLRGKFRTRRLREGSEHQIIFQLCSSSEKHVKNIIPVMKGLERKGYHPVALCWTVMEPVKKPDAADQIAAEGLEAENLEKYGRTHDCVEAFTDARALWRSACARRDEFFSLEGLSKEEIRLGKILWPSIRYFLTVEYVPRVLFDRALTRYMARHSFRAVKIWGEGELPEGRLFLNRLESRASKRPLVFYWSWIPLESPYDPKPGPIDLYLAAGRWQKNRLEARGVSSHRVALAGLPQFDNLLEFSKKTTVENSLANIGVPKGFSRFIFYDFNANLRGYLSVKEQSGLLQSLFKLCESFPSVALLVKPHPAHHQGYLKDAMRTASLKNVFFIPGSALPYDGLNAADVVITKFSTLGLEAMLLGKPVICAVMDGEKRWRIYGDAAETFYDQKNLILHLGRLVGEESFFKEWVRVRLTAQNEFLKNEVGYDAGQKDGFGSRAAEAVESFLREFDANESA